MKRRTCGARAEAKKYPHCMDATRTLTTVCVLTLLGAARCQTSGSLGLGALQDPLPFVRQLANLPKQVPAQQLGLCSVWRKSCIKQRLAFLSDIEMWSLYV